METINVTVKVIILSKIYNKNKIIDEREIYDKTTLFKP